MVLRIRKPNQIDQVIIFILDHIRKQLWHENVYRRFLFLHNYFSSNAFFAFYFPFIINKVMIL